MHDLLHPCQVWSYFWASAQTYDCLCQWVHTIVLMSCYLFRSLYILCTACRILAYRLMLFVFHTTRNKAYLILSYLKDYERCIHISIHIFEFVQQVKTKCTMQQPYMLPILYSQYHACWCPGDLRSQGISGHDIDHIRRNIPSLAIEELYTISNDCPLLGWC